eukprot:m.399792 g.399792  ORF g.399792 m.399792 type:complete len:595 (-) comp16781_c1_seq40:1395-3179(-)
MSLAGLVGRQGARYGGQGSAWAAMYCTSKRGMAGTSDAQSESDYVVVGAGSAGCVMAARLSEDADSTVTVLEAGMSDRWKWDSWKIHMPAALTFNLADDRYNWSYKTVPQKHVDNRQIDQPRGKVVGGSSSLNAMVYIRGHALDYDRWVTEGAQGWSYSEVLPYFRKAQSHELGADDYRGGDGPLRVTTRHQPCELFDIFVEAGKQAGYAETSDINGFRNEGLGMMDATIADGYRWSAATAYLWPALERPNLTLLTGQLTTRILFEDGRAVGVETQTGPNEPLVIHRARKEVILAGGALNSPQLLMLSGVGNGESLEKVGVKPIHDLPGVGQNLQDHLDLYLQWECPKPITLYSASFPHNKLLYGAEWLLQRTGPCASAHLESGGFIRSRAGIQHPDIQFHFLPGALIGQLEPGGSHAFQVHASTMRETSRGHMELKSANPFEAPLIDPNYLATQEDVEDLRAAVRLTREIIEQPVFDDFRGDPISPMNNVESDEDIDAWVRRTTHSAYHPCGCCKMGARDDPTAVVDPEGRVIGLDALRVVDSSIMPSVVSGNLNAPTIMMAEKLADVIRGKTPLPKSDAKVWVHPEWETKQR